MRKEFNHLVAVMNKYDLYDVADEVGVALNELSNKIAEADKRMECAVRTSKDINKVISKFTENIDKGLDIQMSVGEFDTILLGTNDIELALDLEDGICVEDNWYGIFKEPEAYAPPKPYNPPQDNEAIKDIIARLKELNVDGETMEYIIKEVGMTDQMLRQLVLKSPESTTLELIDEKNAIIFGSYK